MIEALILRLDAPLMSFGGVVVDNLGITNPFPGRSMLAGIIGNALGYRHGDSCALDMLQSRIRYAVRCDRRGQEIVDYQTVDLGQSFLGEEWTTRGTVEGREGGTASAGTHIRYRHYLADAAYTVALTLVPADPSPTLVEVAESLRQPRRPLFLGRKCCLPSGPLFECLQEGASLLTILQSIPPLPHRGMDGPKRAWWPADGEEREASRLISVFDDRDWTNQIHAGRRWMREGVLDG